MVACFESAFELFWLAGQGVSLVSADHVVLLGERLNRLNLRPP